MKEYRFCPTCAKNGLFVKKLKDHQDFIMGHYRDEKGFCGECKHGSFASKRPNEYRVGEGYLVVSIRNGEEVTVVCPTCQGFGYILIREYFVSDKHRE